MFEQLQENRIKEGISGGCLTALSSHYGIYLEKNIDDDYGVDYSIRKIINVNGNLSHGSSILDIQLKSSTKWNFNGDTLSYPLRVKNQNDMIQRNIEGSTKILLILMCLNKDKNKWCNISESELKFQNSLFWYIESSTTTNKSPHNSTKTIYIPKTNILTKDQFTFLIETYDPFKSK